MSKMKQILLTHTAPAIANPAYANTLSAITGDLYSALDTVSRELIGFVPSATVNATAARAAVGQQVEYPVAPPQEATDIVPAMSPPSGYDNAFDTRSMAITKSKAVKFNFTGEEQRALNVSPGPDFLTTQGMIFAQGFRTLANMVEADLSAEAAANASRAYGTAGTTPFTSDNLTELAQLKKILDDNGAPAGMRSAIMNTSAGANLRTVKNLTRVNEASTQMTLRQGELLDIFGFSLKETGKPASHTAGTAASATTDNAGYAVGDTVITLASAGTGTFLPGDVVTFAGDANKYVIASPASSGDSDVSDGGTITLAAPGLREPIAASATAITRSASYDAGVVGFSMDAMHVAMRPPEAGTHDLAVDSMLVTDIRSGITFDIRLYEGYRMMYGEIGLAWGVHASKPEHIGLVLG